MVGGEVDAADEGDFRVDHDDLAMQAPEHVQALAEQALAGVEHVDPHADAGHLFDETGRQVGRAKAVHRHIDARAAFGRGNQCLLQLEADLVLEQDEGFQQHFLFRIGNAFENGRKELFAVFQQLKTIPISPVEFHRCISTARGR